MPMRRWLKKRWPLVAAFLLLAYFGYHGVHGSRGFLAWIDKSRELEAATAELAALDDEIRALSTRIEALQPDRADPDLLEQHLRDLGYIGRGEVILLPTPGQGGR